LSLTKSGARGASPVGSVGASPDDLNWAADFWRGVKPYVYLRELDHTLIFPPNRVYKLNDSGFALLKILSKTGRLPSLDALADTQRAEVREFFRSLRAAYDGEPRAAERLPYDFDFTRLPVLGEIALTYACNQACLFCYAGCDGAAKSGGKVMSTREVKKVIRIFKEKAQIPFFSFTGGEPLLRPDLERLTRYARRLGLRTNLVSNGTLATPERARALQKAGLGSAQISIEAPTPELHDELTHRPGSFQRALSGIKALQDAGIPAQTNTTLSRLNLSQAVAMPAFLKSLGIQRFAMNLFIPTIPGPQAERLFVSYTEIGPVVDAVVKAARAEGLTFYWYSPTPFCHYNPIARGLGNKSCAAVDGLISVTPAGDVIPCSSWDEPLGNLLSGRFEDIWFSGRAAHIKNKRYAPPECSGCGSFVACQAACPLYWKFAGTAELSRAAEDRKEKNVWMSASR
jgi:radical SAM protein with 4Fe4S-binding SPASM domain